MPRRIESAGIVVIVLFSIPQPSALSTEHFRRERQLDISVLLGRPYFLGGPGAAWLINPLEHSRIHSTARTSAPCRTYVQKYLQKQAFCLPTAGQPTRMPD